MAERLLLGILVYNGRDVVPACLDSAAQLVADDCDLIVFDDCSPSDGWSPEVERLCIERGIGYYRSPRNLGIPRNMSLVMRHAVERGYDFVGLVNSDVVLPQNLAESVRATFRAGDRIGSITPWSNNVSVFSLPMGGGEKRRDEQSFVNAFSDALFVTNGTEVLDIPTGVGYCLVMDVDVVRHVGVMDPIFGRGYCEEVDWCQRARLAGYRNVLSLGSYVYHAGGGTNRDEGLLAHGSTTVASHEQIVRHRYPDYVERVEDFLHGGSIEAVGERAVVDALMEMARGGGYQLVIGDLTAAASPAGHDAVTVVVSPHDDRRLTLVAVGARGTLVSTEGWTAERIVDELGLPTTLTIYEPGQHGEGFGRWGELQGIPARVLASYPSTV